MGYKKNIKISNLLMKDDEINNNKIKKFLYLLKTSNIFKIIIKRGLILKTNKILYNMSFSLLDLIRNNLLIFFKRILYAKSKFPYFLKIVKKKSRRMGRLLTFYFPKLRKSNEKELNLFRFISSYILKKKRLSYSFLLLRELLKIYCGRGKIFKDFIKLSSNLFFRQKIEEKKEKVKSIKLNKLFNLEREIKYRRVYKEMSGFYNDMIYQNYFVDIVIANKLKNRLKNFLVNLEKFLVKFDKERRKKLLENKNYVRRMRIIEVGIRRDKIRRRLKKKKWYKKYLK